MEKILDKALDWVMHGGAVACGCLILVTGVATAMVIRAARDKGGSSGDADGSAD